MILEARDIHFSYQSREILKGVSCLAGPGQTLAILGPNGVGKTTFLKCLCAIHKPSMGAALVENVDALRMAPDEAARKIGYVAQRGQTARMTVFDAVLLGRKPHIRWRASARDLRIVDAALRRLDLAAMRLRHIDALSGGELQKVCIARALVQEPRLLLLDEPTSSLDLKNQLAILSLVRRAAREHGIAAVMTMHDLNLALRFADAFLFLKDGEVFAHGPMRELRAEIVSEVYGVPVEIHRLGGVLVAAPLVDDLSPDLEPHGHDHAPNPRPERLRAAQPL